MHLSRARQRLRRSTMTLSNDVFFLLAVVLSLSSIVRAQKTGFVSPSFQSTGKGSGPYAHNDQWALGSTQIVAFSTTWDQYRIELWQQSLGGGSAKLSSMFTYKQTNPEEPLPQSFRWTVQTYEFLLSDSPIFFFWLFSDSGSNEQQTSAYFNISIGDSSSPSSTSSDTPTTVLTSSLVTTTTTSVDVSTTSITTAPTASPSGTNNVSEGLSVGAKAGIGIGAALGVIAILAACLVFVKRKRSREERKQAAELLDSRPMRHSFGTPTTAVATTRDTPKPEEMPPYYETRPSELSA